MPEMDINVILCIPCISFDMIHSIQLRADYLSDGFRHGGYTYNRNNIADWKISSFMMVECYHFSCFHCGYI